MRSFKKVFLRASLWSLLGQFGYIAVAFIGNIVLTRFLSPKEFGQVGIIMFFIAIARVLTESGLSGALVRKVDAQEKDYSTIFIFNTAVSIALLVLYIFCAKYVANYYEDALLEKLLIATSSILIINAFQIVPTIRLIRVLDFRKISIYKLISVLLGTIVGCIMAFKGMGVWSIVSVNILTALTLAILLWSFEKGIKKLVFSKESFGQLYKFGLNTTLASILNSVFDNIYQVLLAKYFSINQTGLYYQAKKLQEAPVGLIKSTTLGVVFSSLSKIQNEKPRFESAYKRILTFFTVSAGCVFTLIYLYSENIIFLFYGEAWVEAAFFMKILIVASFFFIQEMLNRVIFKVFDRTSIILNLEIVKKIIQSVSILIGIYYRSLELLMYGFLISSIISYLINNFYSRKVFSFSSFNESKFMLLLCLCCVMNVFFHDFLIDFLSLSGLSTFVIVPILILSYFVALRVLNVIDIVRELKFLSLAIKGEV